MKCALCEAIYDDGRVDGHYREVHERGCVVRSLEFRLSEVGAKLVESRHDLQSAEKCIARLSVEQANLQTALSALLAAFVDGQSPLLGECGDAVIAAGK